MQERPWPNIALFLITLAILALCGVLIYPFLTAIIGAITIAVATDKPYRWLESRCPGRSFPALLGVLIITIILVTPLFFLGEALVKQGLNLALFLRGGAPQEKLADFMLQHPAFSVKVDTITDQFDIAQTTQRTASFLAGKLGGLLGDSFAVITQLVLMMFMLFFAYRDRALAIATLRRILPLSDSETTQLLTSLSDTIYATAYGRVAISLVQGTLATLAYWLLGVPSPILWGLATVVAAMIPLVGALCIWAPIALYLALSGHWVKALMLAAWGGVIVSTIDNYLYPVLVGSRIEQHTVAILISVLGGVALFGIPGIILGPLILSTTKTLLDIWSQRTATTDSL